MHSKPPCTCRPCRHTIGSFPQTAEIRKARAQFRRGELSQEQYEAFLKQTLRETIHFQEETGLDVLVHGEAERTDMVEYFGEQLQGFAITENGWVQSYGSRCVKPPILFGDVIRREPRRPVDQDASVDRQARQGHVDRPVTILGGRLCAMITPGGRLPAVGPGDSRRGMRSRSGR